MAGVFGMSRDNFSLSLKIGQPLIDRMRDSQLDIGTTECSSCRLQMEQGTTTQTLHPLKLLALSYGLAPEVHHRLMTPSRKLVIT